MYSEKDKAILLRWQAAKIHYDYWESFVDSGSSPRTRREDWEVAIIQEHDAADLSLNDFEDPALAAKAKRLRTLSTDFPEGGTSETPEGSAILARRVADIRAIRQQFFDISLEVGDLFPHISKKVH
jgi:hypothetical protein